MKVFVSFSGGKESTLALFQAMRMGFEPRFLLTMFNSKGKKTRAHGLSMAFLAAQADALGIPLLYGRASWRNYEKVFVKLLKRLKAQGIEGGVFGDVYLGEHRQWVERVCSQADLRAFLPLWGWTPERVYMELIGNGFRAMIVELCTEYLPESLLGRFLDEEILELFVNHGVDPCGEKGEYHTAVIDGPIFRKRIKIIKTRLRRRGGRSRLEIIDFVSEDK